MMAPPDCAYSAPKKFVCILNSCTASTDGLHFRSVGPLFCSVVLTSAPSTSTSEVEFRVPFATKFVLLGLMVPAAPFTPGVRFNRLRGFRPMFGSAVMYRFSITCPRVEMVMFRSGAWLRTSTVSVTPPTSNETSNVACWDEDGFSSCSTCPCHRAAPNHPAGVARRFVSSRLVMLPSPRTRGLGLRNHFFCRGHHWVHLIITLGTDHIED